MKRSIIIAALMLFSIPTFASILLEPYAGYDSSKWKYENTSVSGTASGMNFGARLGVAFPMIWFAADVLTNSDDFKTSSATDSSKRTAYGATAGVNTYTGIRAWVGYYFADKVEDTTTKATVKGSSYKVGAGYKMTMLPVSLNLEYIMATYNKDSNGNALTNKMTQNSWLFSVSFPFSFM